MAFRVNKIKQKFFHSKEKKNSIHYASLIASKEFYFRVKALCISICISVNKEVCNCFQMITQTVCYRIKNCQLQQFCFAHPILYGEDGVKKEMIEKGIAESAIENVQPLFNFTGTISEKIEKLSALLVSSEEKLKEALM